MREVVRVRPLLGTFVVIRAAGTTSDWLMTGIDRAFGRVADVHRLMSFHDPASELSRINREALRRDVAVSADTWAVLSLARHIHSVSDGLFDAAVAPLLMRGGHLPHQPTSPVSSRKTDTPAGHDYGTLSDLRLHPNGRVRFARPLQLDLGGIAKGFAVDCAVEALRDSGVPCGSVNAGGDLRVFGDTATRVHVRDPRQPDVCLPLAELREAAVATSASYFTSRIIDPRRAAPCRRRSSVSVIAARCVVADALTKVVLLDERRAAPILHKFSASAVVITGSGRTRTLDGHAA